MNPLELYEAYSAVYAPQEVDEAEKPFPYEKVTTQQKKHTAAGRYGNMMKMGLAKRRAKEAEKTGGSQQDAGKGWYHAKEEFDVFDVVLEFLYVEGYAETLEEAEWMMANIIDEEAIAIVLGEEELDEADSLAAMQARREKRQKANMKKHGTPGFDYSKPPSGKKGYLDAITKKEEYVDEAMSSYDRNRQRAAQRAAARNAARKEGKTGAVPGVGYVSPRSERETYRDSAGVERHTSGARMPKNEEYVDEAQHARENPEKYEREQAKKSAPVRGEKTPMPPRGDKRREDFEKWYAKNVR
jgi:hypothetical protein